MDSTQCRRSAERGATGGWVTGLFASRFLFFPGQVCEWSSARLVSPCPVLRLNKRSPNCKGHRRISFNTGSTHGIEFDSSSTTTTALLRSVFLSLFLTDNSKVLPPRKEPPSVLLFLRAKQGQHQYFRRQPVPFVKFNPSCGRNATVAKKPCTHDPSKVASFLLVDRAQMQGTVM